MAVEVTTHVKKEVEERQWKKNKQESMEARLCSQACYKQLLENSLQELT
jgi:hypothetical protein